MRRKILLLITVLLIGLTACSGSTSTITYENESKDRSMFVLVETGSTYEVVYHRDTKVMYNISDGPYSYGQFTVMVDVEGNPLLYEED